MALLVKISNRWTKKGNEVEMNEHEKREEVIKGLECCSVPPKNRYCDSCPIGFGDGCRLKLKRAALALLKAQEARVMTVSEIGALANGDVVWVEFTDGRLLPMMVEDGCLMRWRFLWRICEDAFYDENYKARAWTSRPTEEQREKEPWNEYTDVT